jgi:PAS domain S-box-containing protein
MEGVNTLKEKVRRLVEQTVPCRFGSRRFLISALGTAFLLVSIYVFFDAFQKTRETHLLRLGDLAADVESSISGYVWERTGDAIVAIADPEIRDMVIQSNKGGGVSDDKRIAVAHHLQRFRETYGYVEIYVVNRGRNVVAVAGDGAEIVLPGHELDAVLSQGGVRISTTAESASRSGPFHFDLIAAVRDESGSQTVGAIIFQIRTSALRPMLTPPDFKLADAQLVLAMPFHDQYILQAASGAGKLVSSFTSDESLKETYKKLSNNEVSELVVRGLDERGVNSLSYIRKIPKTNWFVLAKVDETKLLIQVWKAAAFEMGLVLLLGLVTIGTFSLWSYRQRYFKITSAAERLLATQKLAHLGTWEWHIESSEMNWSGAASEVFGPGRGEPLPRSLAEFLDHVHTDDLSLVKSYFESLGAGKTPMKINFRLFKGNRSIAVVELQGIPESGGGLRNDRVLGIIQDVTVIRRAEESLRLSEAELNRTFIEMPEAFIRINFQDAAIVKVNRATLAMLGYEAEGELLGQSLADKICAMPSQYFEVREKLLTTNKVASVIVNCLKKHEKAGDSILMDFSMRLVRAPNGVPISIECFGRDVTEREKARRELENHEHGEKKAMREKIGVMTSQLKRLSGVKYQLDQELSREIRAPVTVVDELSQAMRLSWRREKIPEDLAKISKAAGVLEFLADELELGRGLYSVSGSAEVDVHTRVFKLADVFSYLDLVLAEKAGVKKNHLCFEIAPNTPEELVGDPVRLAQALKYVGASAIESVECGEIFFEARARESKAESVMLAIQIRCRGREILGHRPVYKLDRIFTAAEIDREPGFIGDEALSVEPSRSLDRCKTIIDQLGGVVDFSGRSDKGGILYKIELEMSLPERPGFGTRDRERWREKNILVVDNGQISRLVAYACLESAGYNALITDSVHAAVDLLKLTDRRFDLVVIDLLTPDFAGLESTRDLRGVNGYKDLLIIGMTAEEDEMNSAALLSIGLNDLVAKPVVAQRLVPLIDQRLNALVGTAAFNWKDSPQFNANRALSRLRGNQGLLVHLLRRFMGSQSSNLEFLKDAIDRRDWGDVERRSHALYGSSESISAENIHALARELEGAAGTGDCERCRDLISRIEQAYVEFERAVAEVGVNQ